MEVRPERQAQEENAIASGISGPDAKACKVPVIAPGLVASKRVDQDKRSLRDWLVPRTGKRDGSCNALAAKILDAKHEDGSAVTGRSIKNFCANQPADVVLKFFEDLEIDAATAELIRVGPAKMQADGTQSTRKKRQHMGVSVDEAGDALASKQPRVQSTHQYETLGSDDASAQMTDAAAGARLAKPRRLKQEQSARMLLPGARLESWRRVQHGRLQVVHEAGQAVYAVLRLRRVVWEPAQRASTARSEIAARAKRHGAGGYRGHVGRHGPRAVQCAPLHPHEVLPAGVHAAR